ncbi:protein of unknown function [Candidatus Methylomirabilis oxygeniifera]|uniref:Uncharacterized protein n=1 Tax=Methylomirabilis oxygeniifera TaxID=671143 RepID=D5MFI9_METO1|nr:protein of unknown function [Candidatus Methylomirabilis oxyfera]
MGAASTRSRSPITAGPTPKARRLPGRTASLPYISSSVLGYSIELMAADFPHVVPCSLLNDQGNQAVKW